MSVEKVKNHYAEVARMASEAEVDPETGFYVVQEARSACGVQAGSEAFFLYDEKVVAGVPQRALVASRGCADPVAQAELKPGEVVLDLGCGGGVDAIISSRLVGDEGRVYGLDMTPEMLDLARANMRSAGARNISFIEGVIEDIPLPDASVNVVVSNCVINFSDDRRAVLAEALRVLAPGGRFVVSDIVSFEDVPEQAREDLCAIVGTTNGMLSVGEYGKLLDEVGFSTSRVEPKTVYTIDVLAEKAARKGRQAHFDRIEHLDVSGKTGSVIIVASKA